MKITTLVENSSPRPDLASEHGLALWIEHEDTAILFDTGASDAFVRNAQALGIDLSTADAIVISHGHYDHTGGLDAAAGVIADSPVYVGRGSTDPKYARRETGIADIGFNPDVVRALGDRIRTVSNGELIAPGVTVLCDFSSASALPADNGRLLAGERSHPLPDPFDDEIAIVLETESGPVLITGCSHRGIGNIVVDATRHFGPLAAVFGGFHLHKESEERVASIAEDLKGVPRIIGGHCTGDSAMAVLRGKLGKAVSEFHTGSVLEID